MKYLIAPLIWLARKIRNFQRLVFHRIYIAPKLEKEIIHKFQKLYFYSHLYGGKTTTETNWLGVQVLKNPLDLWIYQEIISEHRPDVIIESGTMHGGSALYLASICDLVGNGRVVTIDTQKREARPQHPRVEYLTGSSTSAQVVEQVTRDISSTDKVMVILDSDHRKQHVLEELRIYSKLVTKGNFLIVEDSYLNGHPVFPEFGPGPMEAIEEFLEEDTNYSIDRGREKFLMTSNPKGYLQRIK